MRDYLGSEINLGDWIVYSEMGGVFELGVVTFCAEPHRYPTVKTAIGRRKWVPTQMPQEGIAPYHLRGVYTYSLGYAFRYPSQASCIKTDPLLFNVFPFCRPYWLKNDTDQLITQLRTQWSVSALAHLRELSNTLRAQPR